MVQDESLCGDDEDQWEYFTEDQEEPKVLMNVVVLPGLIY